ncbi:NAD(P)/FAD-dependent oxidoreductase [Bdellovibrionota bacterium FG-1]
MATHSPSASLTIPSIPLNQFESQGPWDVIVIGSGMGGMACAAALSKYGRKVLILEQHYVAGGFTHTFSRKGFTWDVGVHCLGEMGKKKIPGRLLNWLSNGHIRMEPLGNIYERFFFPDGFQIEFPSSRQDFKQTLLKAFPQEEASIDRYFAAILEVIKSAKVHFLLRTFPIWAAVATQKVMALAGRKNYWTQTTDQVLSGIIPNARLRAVLCAQWGYYGSTPRNSSFAIHAMTVQHFMGGGYYPAGGSKTIAASLLKTVHDAGGQTVVRAPVREILIEKGKAVGVILENGREIRAKTIISAAGARTTTSLLPAEQRAAPWATEIAELKQSPPHVCLYFGLEGDIQAAGATRANQWFFETWDMEVSGWDVRDPKSVAPALYVSFPSLKDPLHDPGPNNQHTMEALTFVPWEAFEKWKDSRRGNRDKDYMEFKKDIEQRLLAQLQRHIPKLMSLVRHHELSTPLSTTFFTRAPQGAIYGLAPTPERFSNPHLRTRTPIPGLYMAGADVASLGVTGALVGGVLAAATIEPRVFSKLV